MTPGLPSSTLVLVLALVSAMSLPAVATSARPSEAEFIRRARRIDVGRIEPSLPHERLDTWLRRIAGPGARFYQWELNGCGESTGSPAHAGRDRPLCVEVGARLADGRSFSLNLIVGDNERGWHDPPGFYWGAVDSLAEEREVLSLSDLAGRLRAPLPQPEPVSLHPWLADRWHAESGGILDIAQDGRFTITSPEGRLALDGLVTVAAEAPVDSIGLQFSVVLVFQLAGTRNAVRGVFTAGEGDPRGLRLQFRFAEADLILRESIGSASLEVDLEGTPP